MERVALRKMHTRSLGHVPYIIIKSPAGQGG